MREKNTYIQYGMYRTNTALLQRDIAGARKKVQEKNLKNEITPYDRGRQLNGSFKNLYLRTLMKNHFCEKIYNCG